MRVNVACFHNPYDKSMKQIYLILTILLLAACTVEQDLSNNDTNNAVAVNQSGKCQLCAPSEFAVEREPDTTFTFSNGKQLLICGTYELLDGKNVFSEFVLSECGDKRIIDFWEASQRFEVAYANDTLKLHKLELLALGNNRELVDWHWLTEVYYYRGNRLKHDIRFNTSIKYNTAQINETLREYEQTKWLPFSNATDDYLEEKKVLANRLLIASLSGSDKAENYLKEFDSKLKDTGSTMEWYNQLVLLHKAASKGRPL